MTNTTAPKETEPTQTPGSCFLVGAPIDERDDLSQRAIRTLQSADLVVAGDQQKAARLLKRFALSKKLLGIESEIVEDVANEVTVTIQSGKRVAVLSNPGFALTDDIATVLSASRSLGLEPRVIPGVDIVSTLLAMSGFRTVPHTFLGTMPDRREKRADLIREADSCPHTVVIDGGVSRIIAALNGISDVMPHRNAAIVLRPTVPGESILRGNVIELADRFASRNYRGPWGVVVAPVDATTDDADVATETDIQSESGGDEHDTGR